MRKLALLALGALLLVSCASVDSGDPLATRPPGESGWATDTTASSVAVDDNDESVDAGNDESPSTSRAPTVNAGESAAPTIAQPLVSQPGGTTEPDHGDDGGDGGEGDLSVGTAGPSAPDPSPSTTQSTSATTIPVPSTTTTTVSIEVVPTPDEVPEASPAALWTGVDPDSAFCVASHELDAASGGVDAIVLAGPGDDADDVVARYRSAVNATVLVAPSEIVGAFSRFAIAMDAALDGFAAVGYDIELADLSALDVPDVIDAEEAIDDYVARFCPRPDDGAGSEDPVDPVDPGDDGAADDGLGDAADELIDALVASGLAAGVDADTAQCVAGGLAENYDTIVDADDESVLAIVNDVAQTCGATFDDVVLMVTNVEF